MRSALKCTQDERDTPKMHSFKTGCKYQATHTQNPNLCQPAGKGKGKATNELRNPNDDV